MKPARRHENHHFVPEFLLRQWEGGTDEKLTTYAWKNGVLRTDRHKAKSVCALPGLYSFSAPERERNALESEVMQSLDDHAARIHAALLLHPTVDLPPRDQLAWTWFIAALMIRTPWELEAMVKGVPAMVRAWEEEFDATPEERLENEKIISTESSARDFMLETWPTLWQGRIVDLLVDADWVLLDLTKSPLDLLIGDQALLRNGPLHGPFVIFVPLAPKRLLLIASRSIAEGLARLPPRQLAIRANTWTAESAQQYVYGTSDSHWRFLSKRFEQDRVIPPTVYR